MGEEEYRVSLYIGAGKEREREREKTVSAFPSR